MWGYSGRFELYAIPNMEDQLDSMKFLHTVDNGIEGKNCFWVET